MSTSIALASAAGGQAAAAASLAARASCIASVRGYAHDSATVAEMREYMDTHGGFAQIFGDERPKKLV